MTDIFHKELLKNNVSDIKYCVLKSVMHEQALYYRKQNERVYFIYYNF